MISINNIKIQAESEIGTYSPNSLKGQVLHTLFVSEKTYDYKTKEALIFELDLREKIVRAAEKLSGSRFDFEVFKNSKCNPEFWKRTNKGGFLLRPDVSPFIAIKDILVHSNLYATECATAIVIVFYLALAEMFPELLFNKLFSDIYLMDWQYLDKDIGMRSHDNLPDYLAGDCRYFKNPDVDPKTIEWQGENAIQLMNGYYYGHGIGIRTAESMIAALNQHRKPGATRAAYLMDLAIKPGYKYLYREYEKFNRQGQGG